MKILNLYAGIGGNRKLWGDDHDVTMVEMHPDIAHIYSTFYPNDTIVIGDAHQYLIDHYKEFDFIWSSPPCPSHSRVRTMGVHRGITDAVYPNMDLYQEIILLKHFAKGDWVIENVKPYYEYLIEPDFSINRHPFWSNLNIASIKIEDSRIHTDIIGTSTVYGFNLDDFKIKDYKGGKRKVLRNLVNPEVGEYILNSANRLDSNNLNSTINWVCSDCGLEANRLTCLKRYGAEPLKPCFDVSTYHRNTCDVCRKETYVTQPRDFFYPDFSLLEANK